MATPESSSVDRAPRFTAEDSERLTREHYGIQTSASPLPSERDQNFRMTSPSGERYVLKIANPTERHDVLDLQSAAMDYLMRHVGSGSAAPCPRVCPTLAGEPLVRIRDADGVEHYLRLLTFLPGRPLARVRPHSPGLLRSLGGFFGELDTTLLGFDHPAAHREFLWDLRAGESVVRAHLGSLPEPAQRERVEGFLERFRRVAGPLLGDLPCSVIHADGNDYNVLVQRDGDDLRVTGVIDFGDTVHGYTVGELAIAVAYAMLHKAEPLEAAAHVVAGYHDARALEDAELAALYPMIGLRLCTSVCLSAHQIAQAPDNEYLVISSRPAWELLERLAPVSPAWAEIRLREACALEPCPRAVRVAAYLRSLPDLPAPVVEADLRGGDAHVFDFSVGSPQLEELDLRDGSHGFEPLMRRIEESGATAGIGRYDEARLAYASQQFEVPSDELPERRTVHLGIDVFCAPGSPIFAPLDGKVHSFADNAAELDYGPTILLEHVTDLGEPFYTLYGHLSDDSLAGLRPGREVSRGQRIGAVGAPPGNGGWAPHLHFQLIADMLGQCGTFPGVAPPGQRRAWLALCPDPNLLLGIPDAAFPPRPPLPDRILARRRQRLGPSLSVSYRRPLEIVRGRGPYLYDHEGREYLDGVNNVCHVGHCHPRVVAAGRAQMGVLNTNTRYLHQHVVRFAERLVATMPEPLEVCFFVCTGSEANELALRMARAYTGRHDVVVLEGAYHGHTQALIDVSSYKFDGPGGRGAPEWVHEVAMPDGYRGSCKGRGEDAGAHYAGLVRQTLDSATARKRPPAAFFCESLLGCGGQIVPPAGYLRAAFEQVREAGGVSIADEVQVGFGRVGSHFWAFEAQQAVPDIVTLGKPIGNGHPIGAVLTTRAIADAFADGMEYFNTFGGNPVSCAIGLAVLDVIRDEGLQDRALQVGSKLLDGLSDLQARHPLIGDVRGRGLFVGVELVLDREELRPARSQADYVVERMRDHGILISTDGPLGNVLKIKPPLVFDERHADRLVQTLDGVLSEDVLRP